MKNSNKIAIVLVLCLLVKANLLAQVDKPGSEIPAGLMSLLVVPDPKCPIQITGPFRVIGWSYGGFEFGYTLENHSNAGVESVYFQEWDWLSAHGYEGTFEFKNTSDFQPGMSHYSFSGESEEDLIPYDQNKGLQSQVSHTSNKLWIVMVVRVKLSDGTVYDATKKYEQLEKFLESRPIAGAEKLNKWERDLRQFVSKLMIQEK